MPQIVNVSVFDVHPDLDSNEVRLEVGEDVVTLGNLFDGKKKDDGSVDIVPSVIKFSSLFNGGFNPKKGLVSVDEHDLPDDCVETLARKMEDLKDFISGPDLHLPLTDAVTAPITPEGLGEFVRKHCNPKPLYRVMDGHRRIVILLMKAAGYTAAGLEIPSSLTDLTVQVEVFANEAERLMAQAHANDRKGDGDKPMTEGTRLHTAWAIVDALSAAEVTPQQKHIRDNLNVGFAQKFWPVFEFDRFWPAEDIKAKTLDGRINFKPLVAAEMRKHLYAITGKPGSPVSTTEQVARIADPELKKAALDYLSNPKKGKKAKAASGKEMAEAAKGMKIDLVNKTLAFCADGKLESLPQASWNAIAEKVNTAVALIESGVDVGPVLLVDGQPLTEERLNALLDERTELLQRIEVLESDLKKKATPKRSRKRG